MTARLLGAIIGLSAAIAPRPAVAQECGGVGEAKFLCLSATAEDMVAIPGSDWIVLSGELRAVDTRDGSEVTLFSPDPRFDRTLYSACPGPLTGREMEERRFRAHGVNLRPGTNGVHTLYVVHHTGRESVEVFELDARGRAPTIAWIGCAISPEGVTGNSVAVLPDHGFALTNFLDRSLGGFLGADGARVRGKLGRGERTGEVWEWGPERGWVKVPGSEGSGPNGIEASPDGKRLYLAEWGARKLIELSRGESSPTRRETSLDFHPDNLRWQADGSLLVAGQRGTVEAILSDCLSAGDCSEVATSVAAIDPQSLGARDLVRAYPANQHFAAGTTALRVRDEIWVGSTYRGRRIARFVAPRR
ncbi:MAG: hypothetical protein R2909_17665 [Gemmatimonadales bacterium]